jgi:hypothetical protein
VASYFKQTINANAYEIELGMLDVLKNLVKNVVHLSRPNYFLQKKILSYHFPNNKQSILNLKGN